jgi:hypothetical protein
MKQRAELAGCSERTLYMAKTVQRLRPDLSREVMAGTMTINRAYRLATKHTKPTKLQKFIKDWADLNEDERAAFLVSITADIEVYSHAAAADFVGNDAGVGRATP